MTDLLPVLAAVLAALVAGVCAFVLSGLMQTKSKVGRRMTSLGDLVSSTSESMTSEAPVATLRVGKGENTWLAWLEQRYPLSGGTRTGMIAFAAASLVLVLFGAFLIFVYTPVVLAIPLSLAGAFGTLVGVGSIMESGKREEYNDRLLLAMDDLQRMVRFGIPTMQALTSAAEAADEPLRASLRNVLLETGFGVPLEQAVAQEARRVRMNELAMLATILSTQASTGGNLSESVGNLATMLRERRDNRAKMKAATAESRITLIILAIVPFVGVGIQAASQPEVVATLFGEARHLLGIGVGLIGGAFVLSWLFIRSAQR